MSSVAGAGKMSEDETGSPAEAGFRFPVSAFHQLKLVAMGESAEADRGMEWPTGKGCGEIFWQPET